MNQAEKLNHIMSRCVKRESGCIEWNGCLTPVGYGQLTINFPKRRRVYAHRLVWELTNGPIPEGMMICHHCDNRKCVNVEHLFVGTAKDNAQDMAKKGRAHRPVGELSPRAKLSNEAVEQMREWRKRGASMRAISQMAGVCPSHVSRVLSGVRWKA